MKIIYAMSHSQVIPQPLQLLTRIHRRSEILLPNTSHLQELISSPHYQSLAVGVITIFSLFLAWSTWYIWSFKISPWLWPSDAPPYPYAIPVFGHAYDYFLGSHELIAKARRYFKDARTPFAIVLAGVRHYVITSPTDAHFMYSKPMLFNFDVFLSKALFGFGVSPCNLDDFWKKRPQSTGNPKGKCLVHVTEDIYKRSLLPGPDFTKLIESHKISLSYQLSFEQLACRCGLSTAVRTDTVSLYGLCTTTMIESMQTCLFDPIILSIDPGMTRDMMDFTDDLWMLMHPTSFCDSSKPKATLKRYHTAMKRYQKLPEYMRRKESSLLTNLIDQYREYKIDEDDAAAVLVMVYWAAVSNVAKLSYWMIANVLLNEDLCTNIRSELLPAINGEKIDSSYLLKECPMLKSVYLETLRLIKMDHSYRRLEKDVEVGGSILRKGSTVILSVAELHRDQDIFGTNAVDFDPTRFLKRPDLVSSRSFRPYGSGTTSCPGREFALQETLVFVALFLHRYNVQLVGGRSTRPELDQQLLTVGLCRPVPETDLQLSLQLRSSPRGGPP